jgi:hypothetical protein
MVPAQVMKLYRSKKPYVGFSDNTSKQVNGALTQVRMSLTEAIKACLCVRMFSSSAPTLPAAMRIRASLFSSSVSHLVVVG